VVFADSHKAPRRCRDDRSDPAIRSPDGADITILSLVPRHPGIIFVIRNGLRWRDVPPSYGPHKTIYNRFIRWSELGVFGRIFVELAKGGGDTAELMIDATHLKAHRTAASLLKKGLFPGISDAPRAG
jgi:putative transposase